MGMLVNGVWHDEDPPTVGEDGSFVRLESGFRDRVTRDGSSGFKAEAGRYYLVTAPSCPWAHRTVLMRKLKGLEDAIPILQSDLPKGQGWAYSRGFDDLRPTAFSMSTKSIAPRARASPAAPLSRSCGTARRARSSTMNRPKSSAC
jgi:glutathionyl-hydroquinone reductase